MTEGTARRYYLSDVSDTTSQTFLATKVTLFVTDVLVILRMACKCECCNRTYGMHYIYRPTDLDLKSSSDGSISVKLPDESIGKFVQKKSAKRVAERVIELLVRYYDVSPEPLVQEVLESVLDKHRTRRGWRAFYYRCFRRAFKPGRAAAKRALEGALDFEFVTEKNKRLV
jgi:hypothetical protein